MLINWVTPVQNMAVYIELALFSWNMSSPREVYNMLQDGLDIACIDLRKDAQIIEQTQSKLKVELCCEHKISMFYQVWEHIAKYLAKRYCTTIEKVSMDDTERAVHWPHSF